MPDLVTVIAAALPTLTHPGHGDGPIALPTAAFRAGHNLPPDVASQFAADAGLPHADLPRLHAEAIAHAITAAGLTVVTTADAARLDTQADPTRQVTLVCHCGADLLTMQLHDADTPRPRCHGPQLITSARQLNPLCLSSHQCI